MLWFGNQRSKHVEKPEAIVEAMACLGAPLESSGNWVTQLIIVLNTHAPIRGGSAKMIWEACK